MPTYNFKCNGCQKVTEEFLSVGRRKEPCETPCKECGGEVVSYISGASSLLYGGVKTPQSAPDGFKDVLRTIKKGAGKESTIDV